MPTTSPFSSFVRDVPDFPNAGILFRAPDNVKQQFPQFPAVETYADLMNLIKQEMA